MSSMLSLATRGRKAIDQVAMAGPYNTTYGAWENLRTWPGYGISPEAAYNIITVYQCVRVLAETFASLPLLIYRKLPGGGKERALDHPLFDVLHRRPNPDMTSFIWRELLMSHLATWGNAYNEKAYDGAGHLQLWPIRPDRIEPFYYPHPDHAGPHYDRPAGSKGFWYLEPSQGKVELDPESIFHVQGLSSNGLVGFSPISVMRSTLRLYQTAERFGTSFFDNDARPGTILSHPKNLSTPAIERLRGQMESLKGPDNAGRTIVLEEGLTVSEVGIHPEDAQFMETRLFQKREIAAAFRIQPHKIGDLERATFSNIEQQSIEFISDTMLPWFVRTEMEIDTQLVAPLEQDDVFAEFLVDGYLRGDAKTRAEALAIRWQHGTLNADEWRAHENENPIPDGVGQAYYVPVNYQPAEGPGAPPPAAGPPPGATPGSNGTARTVEQLLGATSPVRSMAQFDCPRCGRLLARKAMPGTVAHCGFCKREQTMPPPEAIEALTALEASA